MSGTHDSLLSTSVGWHRSLFSCQNGQPTRFTQVLICLGQSGGRSWELPSWLPLPSLLSVGKASHRNDLSLGGEFEPMAWFLPTLFMILATTQGQALDSIFTQVAPVPPSDQQFARSDGQTCAVIVIEGYALSLSHRNKDRADFHSYQRPNSRMVKSLSGKADVFSFAYGQDRPVTTIAPCSGLLQHIHTLHTLGYTEIVLVGFSSGGLIARQIVEDMPDSGVTKVIQVCSPNAGTGWAAVAPDDFAHSLGAKARRAFFAERQGKSIPATIQFACIVATGAGHGDGVVSVHSQWPEDLQAQGIPAYVLHASHLRVPRGRAGVELITTLVCENQPRWNATQVAAMRKRLHVFLSP